MSHSAESRRLNMLFLPYEIREWNKLDPEIRKAETYAFIQKMLLNFIRPTGNGTCKILTRLE